MCMCVSMPTTKITSGVMWHDMDFICKFYSFYMAPIVVSLVGVALALMCTTALVLH